MEDLQCEAGLGMPTFTTLIVLTYLFLIDKSWLWGHFANASTFFE
jgi:hypothetical protein